MPIGNCVNKLLKNGDFNVRTTVLSPISFDAWCEVIRDSLGGGILSATNHCHLVLTLPSGNAHYTFTTGKNIIPFVKFHCSEPTSIRIDISYGPHCRSWVFFVV